MAVSGTYDSIYRFAPKWIESRGSLMPVQVEYRAWGAFAASTVVFAVMWGVLGSPTAEALFRGATLGLLAAMLLIRFAQGDLTIMALVRLSAAEVATVATYRLARPERPVRMVLR